MKHFGELAFHIRGIVYYKLSPHEIRPYGGAVRYGLPNFVPRTMATLPYWLPAFVSGIVTYKWVTYKYWLNGRKNPKDYIDEVDPNPPQPLSEEEKEEQAAALAEEKKKKC